MDTLTFFITAVIFLVAADIITIVFLLKFRFLKNKAEKEVIRRNETEELLKSVFSSMTEGLMVVNKEGKVILFNQAAAILLKMAPGEAVGKKIEDVFYIFKQKFGEKGRLNFISGFLKKIIDKPDIITVGMSDNFYCRSKSGREYPVGAVMASLLKNGQSIGATIIFRNIAREKEVDRAKSEFVSLASHQLQTPLAAINWYAETLLNGDLGQLKKSHEEYVEQIYNSGHRMVELINALLNVSRIELGVVAIEPEPLRLTELADSVLKELEWQIKSKNIKLTKVYEAGLPPFAADPRVMHAVFQNLFSNAVKYTPEKGSVKVAIRREDGRVMIEVRDTGYGIPEEQQSGIFTKLFRADNVLGNDPEGNGLGLYVVKSLLDQSGGSIWFSSEGVDKGSVFFVSFPLSGMKKIEGMKILA